MIYIFVPQIGKLSLTDYRHVRIHKKFSLKQKSIAEKGKIGRSLLCREERQASESTRVLPWFLGSVYRADCRGRDGTVFQFAT